MKCRCTRVRRPCVWLRQNRRWVLGNFALNEWKAYGKQCWLIVGALTYQASLQDAFSGLCISQSLQGATLPRCAAKDHDLFNWEELFNWTEPPPMDSALVPRTAFQALEGEYKKCFDLFQRICVHGYHLRRTRGWFLSVASPAEHLGWAKVMGLLN